MQNFWQDLKKPIIGLAPMDGVTDFPTRKIQCLVDKPDVLYTEFVSVEGFTRNPKHFKKTLFFEDSQRPIIAQVFGYTPQLFYETVLQICSLGFNGIDINMGCPAKKVLGKGGGGALIGNYSLVEKIINACFRAIKKSKKEISLSVKTRVGKKEFETEKWISFLTKFPLSEITVHGRLLKQGNSGNVFWEEIQKAGMILKEKNIICLGNGGVKSLSGARQLCKKYNIDGVLIGQAALGNPWIFKENYKPTKKDILNIVLKHTQITEDFYGCERFVIILKHFSWYPKGFPGCKGLKRELLKTRSLPEVLEVIEKYS